MNNPRQWLAFSDIRSAAQRRLPRGFFEMIDRGAEDDVALMNNIEALRRIKLRSRVLRDVSARRVATTLLGREIGLPVVIAPTGPAGLVWNNGERALARAARGHGIPLAISSAAQMPMERLQEEGGRLWFQLYFGASRDDAHEVVDRAQAAGYEVLVLTVDSIVPYNRPFAARSGFSMPIRPTARGIVDSLLSPRWLLGSMLPLLLRHGRLDFPNYPGYRRMGATKSDALTWDDLNTLRRRWPGRLIVKGVSHPDDARHCMEAGADGVVVSNHGGLAFDDAVATIDVLEEIVAAVDGRGAVIVDGGFRHGADIVKALCLGADAVMLGRVPLLALAAGGQKGVERALDILRREMDRTLALMGCVSVAELTPEHVWRAPP